MEEITNEEVLKKIVVGNGGYITRRDVDSVGVASWFLTDFVRKNNFIRVSPGYYVSSNMPIDDYYVFQWRYPQYIFSGISALFLHHLTDQLPKNMEVTCPQGYNPTRKKNKNLRIRKISDKDIYKFGITEVKTIFGHKVKVYDQERTICDFIKYRDKYDSEVFVKAMKYYVRKTNNQKKLFKYAKKLNVEKKVLEVMEIITNED